MFVSEVRNDPLNPHTVILFLKLELLQTLGIKMSDFFVFEDLFRFLYIVSTLVDNIGGFIDLTQQLFSDSANARPAIDHSIAFAFRVGFKIVHQEFE